MGVKVVEQLLDWDIAGTMRVAKAKNLPVVDFMMEQELGEQEEGREEGMGRKKGLDSSHQLATSLGSVKASTAASCRTMDSDGLLCCL